MFSYVLELFNIKYYLILYYIIKKRFLHYKISNDYENEERVAASFAIIRVFVYCSLSLVHFDNIGEHSETLLLKSSGINTTNCASPTPGAMATADSSAAAPLRQLSQKETDIQMMLAADVHLGTKNCDFQMERYVFKRRTDGHFSILKFSFLFYSFIHLSIFLGFNLIHHHCLPISYA